MGTRDRIISHLGAVTDISDPGGMASTRLAEAVGYPGSSVAFAQLLSGMERDGLIAREVRGKRTYRIILAPGVHPGRARSDNGSRTGDGIAPGTGTTTTTARSAVPGAAAQGSLAEAALATLGAPSQLAARFDYDELARRLLIQVIRRLATPPEGQEGIVADLARELSEARGHASTLTAENRELREQLSQVRHSLDEACASLETRTPAGTDEPRLTRTGPVGEELTASEVVLLERLVAPPRDSGLADNRGKQDATAS